VPAQRGDPWGGKAHGAGRDCDHGNRVADHVEELDRVRLPPYLGYIVMNRGISLPVSICQIEQKRTFPPLGVVIGPSIS